MDLIDVEYEPLPTISSIQAAIDTREPRIHEYGDFGNIHRRQVYEFGDVEAGFAEADFVREDITFYEGSTHLALEQHASVAQCSPDGKVTLWTCTQDMHYLHKSLAKALGCRRKMSASSPSPTAAASEESAIRLRMKSSSRSWR
jgi:CO/xanthine dehydrogenase Mo-binding subunit